jgi:hypothetical protein
MRRKKNARRTEERTTGQAEKSAGHSADPVGMSKALGAILPSTEPPRAVPGTARDESPSAGPRYLGSEVLDVTGAEGVSRRAMHDVIHAPDDEIAEQPLAPGEEADISFRPDREIGDAGAELAEELGRSYLQSATSGEDISEIEAGDEADPVEVGGPFLEIDETGNPVDESGDVDVDVEEDGALVSPAASGEVPPALERAGAGAYEADRNLGAVAHRRSRRSTSATNRKRTGARRQP